MYAPQEYAPQKQTYQPQPNSSRG